ncbi:ParA family protein [Tenacibaculum agarivorans]|uniref:ParA family protein n=1 Tax=Tenacibaculum agarivorans TaxID=1908389 RepID=UPI00094B9F14|nr:ParA family protein [Tenacibaculum agarivorans]
MKTITKCYINSKGGVGKTTSAANCAASLAILGYKILLVDVDSQGNLSKNFGVDKSETTIYDVFMNQPFEVLNVRENIDLIPANLDFSGITLKIQDVLSRELILKRRLTEIQDQYDFVIIDCPPEVSLVTINALACSKYVTIPVEAAQFSLDGIDQMIEFITDVKGAVNEDLEILGILLTKYDEKLKRSKAILREFDNNGWTPALYNTKIRDVTAIADAQFEHKTIFEFNNKSNGAEDYMNFTKECIKKIEQYG